MRRLLSSHYLFYLARSFISAVLVVYLVDQGISLSTIAVAKATQLVVSIAFNVICGKLADRFGNKACALLACISSIAYFSLMIDPSDTRVIAGEALNGLAIALYKGAYEAWSFKFTAEKEPVVSILFRSNEAMFTAMMIAGVLGALFAPQALVISMLTAAIAFFMFVLTPEPIDQLAHINVPKRTQALHSLRRFDVYLYVLVAGLMQLVYQYWPVYLLQASGSALSQKEIGWAFGVCMCVQTLSTRYARRHCSLEQDAMTNFAIGLLLFACVCVAVVPLMYVGKAAAVASYIVFATAAGLYLGLLFAKVCDQFNSLGKASQLISWVDALGRGAGAIFLALLSGVVEEGRVGMIWALLFGVAALGHLLPRSKQVPIADLIPK